MDFEHDAGLELKNQLDKINKLEAELVVLKEVIKENGLEDEVPELSLMSVEEKICLDGINHIAALIESGDFSKDDVNNFNTLYNVLRSIKGKEGTSKKKPKGEVKDLLKAITGGKK